MKVRTLRALRFRTLTSQPAGHPFSGYNHAERKIVSPRIIVSQECENVSRRLNGLVKQRERPFNTDDIPWPVCGPNVRGQMAARGENSREFLRICDVFPKKSFDFHEDDRFWKRPVPPSDR